MESVLKLWIYYASFFFPSQFLFIMQTLKELPQIISTVFIFLYFLLVSAHVCTVFNYYNCNMVTIWFSFFTRYFNTLQSFQNYHSLWLIPGQTNEWLNCFEWGEKNLLSIKTQVGKGLWFTTILHKCAQSQQ